MAVLLLNAQHATLHLICLESGTSKTNFKLSHTRKNLPRLKVYLLT